MASILVPAVWLALAADLTQQIELDVDELSDELTVDGEVRTYAGGRRRSITKAGQPRQIPISGRLLAQRTLLETLTSWRGQVVLYRDARGRKAFGTFFALTVVENPVVDACDISLTLQEVTVSEAV